MEESLLNGSWEWRLLGMATPGNGGIWKWLPLLVAALGNGGLGNGGHNQ